MTYQKVIWTDQVSDFDFCSIVMQYANGGDLLAKIEERRKRRVFFRESQVWRVLIESVHGLHAMHTMNILHRDIKSANVFLVRPESEKSSVKITKCSPSPKDESSASANGGDDEKGQFLFQSKIGDMNVSKI